jgi:hypothetical protein
MSFNKAYLPKVDELKKRALENFEGTARWLKKTDSFIGPSDSYEYAVKIMQWYDEGLKAVPEKKSVWSKIKDLINLN